MRGGLDVVNLNLISEVGKFIDYGDLGLLFMEDVILKKIVL